MLNLYSTYDKVKIGLSKNFLEFKALRNKLYPDFVFDSKLKNLKDEIPVFTLHSVAPDKFEEQLIFLSKNGYQTLIADEFYEYLVGSRPVPERSIMFTFDDGWKNLYSVVYPLLNKYNFRAVCFLIPGLIPSKKEDNYEEESIESIPGSNILSNWDEITKMHESNVIDFQSHSMTHHRIFVSPSVDSFFYPSFDSYAMNLNVPLYRVKDNDNFSRVVKFGTPVYQNSSRFSGRKRYFDDENLRRECVRYVESNGGKEFFRRYNWHKKLFAFVENYRKKYKDSGYFENEEQFRQNIFIELRKSKLDIEKQLSGKTVSHFCYPWWIGSKIASEISKEAGYLSNFWGTLPERRTNKRGDDPYSIARLLSDDFIFRLPGNGRKSLSKIILEKFSSNQKGLTGKLFKTDIKSFPK